MPRRCAGSSLPVAPSPCSPCSRPWRSARARTRAPTSSRAAPATERGPRPPLRRRARSRPASTARPGSARRPATPTRSGCSSSPAAWSASRGERRRTRARPRATEVPLGAEQGLLGIAFHPDFATNRRLYLHWSDRAATRASPSSAPDGTSPAAPRAAARRPARGEPQRRPARVRARRPALPRARRRRRRVRPRASARRTRSTQLGKLLSADVDAPRAALAGRRSPACATRGASRSTPRSARSGSATSARTRSRRSTACCSSPTSRRRTSAGTRSRATARDRGRRLALDRTGELVWPVAGLHARRRLLGHRRLRLPGHGAATACRGATSTATSARGALWSLRGTPEGGATDVRRERAQVPQLTHIGPDADGEPVFASAAGAIYRAVPPARGVAQRAHRAVDPDPHAVAGCQAGNPSRRLRSAQPARQLEVRRAGRGRRTSAPTTTRLGVVAVRRRPRPIATDSGRSTTSTAPAELARRRRSGRARTRRPRRRAVPGSTSASPRNSATQRVRGRS